jgi:site-specific recombinase XerC
MRGAPLIAVKELLGHGTLTMTLRYAHLSPNVKAEVVGLLDKATPEKSWSNIGQTEEVGK